jgi:hypothetical protein
MNDENNYNFMIISLMRLSIINVDNLNNTGLYSDLSYRILIEFIDNIDKFLIEESK